MYSVATITDDLGDKLLPINKMGVMRASRKALSIFEQE